MGKEVITHFTSGTLTVPQELQARLGLHEGSSLALRVEGGNLIAHPLARAPMSTENALVAIKQLQGIFAGPPSLSDELIRLRAEDDEFILRPFEEDDLDTLAGSLPVLRGAVEELQRERQQDLW